MLVSPDEVIAFAKGSFDEYGDTVEAVIDNLVQKGLVDAEALHEALSVPIDNIMFDVDMGMLTPESALKLAYIQGICLGQAFAETHALNLSE